MRIQIRIPLAVISSCLVFAAAQSSWAASIGGSFVGRGGGSGAILAPTDLAGVIAQTNWNNIDSGDPVTDGPSLAQIDDAGNFTAVKIVYDASDSWNSDGGTATANEKLMKGIIKANPDPDDVPLNNSERMVFVITNLPPAGTYNVIVYATANGNFAQMNLSVGSVTNYIEEQAVFSGTFVPATSTTPGVYESGVNYAGYTNVTPAVNGTITIIATKNIEIPQVNDGIGVAGIQIVQVSGPAFPPNTDPCSITANPQSPTFAIDGGTATFTVGTQGPRKIQWTKNNVPIPGAIDSTLVYTAALADDGAQFRAIVYNNVNTNTSAPATLLVDPNTPPTLTQGFMKVERWTGIGGTAVAPLIAAIAANTAPATTYFVAGADVPQTSPDINDFGGRLSGWVKPDVTGEYHFFIRSDDASQLFLNSVNPGTGTNALPDVTTATPICQEDGCCNGFTEPPSPRTSAPIFLEAGKLYGFAALYKEGGGGDFLQVAWRLTNSSTAAGLLRPIAAANSWTLATGAGQRSSIASQPSPTTVVEGRVASFSIGVTTIPVAGLFGVQWFKNGSVIPGATTPTYTTPPTTLADQNAQYHAIAYTLPGPLTSSVVALTVIPDTFPPIPSAGVITRNDGVVQVGVGFDEAVNQADVIPANFSLIGGTGTLSFPTNTYGDYKGILFDTTGLIVGNTYTVRVVNVRDMKGNAISSGGSNAVFTVGNKVGWAESGVPARRGQVIPVGTDGFDILNGGRKEWEAYDEVTIAYVKKTNDFDVKVQVIYAEPGSQWTRVGLMARNQLDVGEGDGTGGVNADASAYAQTHVNPSQTIWSSGRLGAPGPADPPTLNTAATGGTVADGTYGVKTAYVYANAPESLPSPAGTIPTSGGGASTITVSSPPASAGATGWYAYVTQDAGTRYFRQQSSPTAMGTDFVLAVTPTTTGVISAAPANPTPNNGHEQNQRLALGGATSGWGSAGTPPNYPNEWLRLQRQGSTLRGFRGVDGVNWVDQGTTTLTDQQADMFVGPFLAVETANIFNGADFNVFTMPFDAKFHRLFLAQFRNFANTFPPTLSVSRSGSDVVVTFTGSLLSAPSITGPWSPVVSASPYTTPATGAARYFRARGDFP